MDSARRVFVVLAIILSITSIAGSANASCVPVAGETVGWWRAEGNGADVVLGNDGIAAAGVQYAPGIVGQGFLLNNRSNAYLRVPFSAPLNVGTSNGFTIEAWVRLNDVAGFHPIVEYTDGTNGVGVHLWVGHFPWDNGVLYANLIDTQGNSHQIYSEQNALMANVNQHVALTFDRLTGEARLFVNGVPVAQSFMGSITPVTTMDIWIGKRPIDYSGSWTDGTFLNGILDELSIVGRALSTNELNAIYQSGVEGKCIEAASECVPAPTGLISWWKAENTGNDSAGTNHGQLRNGATFSSGNVGNGFQFDGVNSEFRVPASATLDVGTAGGFTIEGWINPTSVDVLQPIVEWNRGDAWGAHFYVDPFSWGVGPGSLYANIVDSSGAWHQIQSPAGTVVSNSFQHVAVTYDKASGVARLYRNGVVVAEQSIGSFTPHTSYDLYLGRRPGGDATYSFAGRLDEISLYNRALATSEINVIYLAGTAGKCVPEPEPECVEAPVGLVSWWRNENSGSDAIGSNHGQIANGATYDSGHVGKALLLTNSNAEFRVPASASIDVGTAGGFTIEGWINPASVDVLQPIVEWNRGDAWGVHFYVDPFSWGVGPGSLYANIVDSGGGWHQVQSPAGTVVSNSFQHVAMTYDKASGVARLYRNGVVVAEQSIGSFTPHTSYDLYLGRRPGGDATYSFAGRLDEISLYNRALSTNEIAAVFSVGAAGKCFPTQPPPPPGPAVPAIHSFNPPSGLAGTNVVISGTNFSAIAASNIVYFGSVRAQVVAASPTQLTVVAPAGAVYAPISVTVGRLTAHANSAFLPSFAGENLANFTPENFGPRLDVAAGTGPGFAVIADLDSDGKPDLAVDNGGNHTISIYRNVSTNGSAAPSFAARIDVPFHGAGENKMLAADVDGDGKLDLLGVDRNAARLVVLKNSAQPGTLAVSNFSLVLNLPTGSDPRGVAVRDLNRDGKQDIAVANWADSTISIYENVGVPGTVSSNTFLIKTVATGTNPQLVEIQDIDGDGAPELITANNGGIRGMSVLHNWSTSTNIQFRPSVNVAGLAGSYSLAIGDLDRDGKADIIVGSQEGGQISIYRNVSLIGSITNSSFAPRVDFAVGAWANAVSIGDLDGDGRPDLAVAAQLPSRISLFKNLSAPGSINSSSFAPRVDLAALWNPNGIAIGDLNADNRPDLAFANTYEASASIYPNRMPYLGTAPQGLVPVITAISPATGVSGSSVTLAGTNFSAFSSSNTVYFGAVRATVTSATSNTLVVVVPAGATFGPISVTVNQLTAFSSKPFLPAYASGSPLSTNSFAPRFDIPAGSGSARTAAADFDRDGRIDLVVVNIYDASVLIYRNIATNSMLSAASFAPPLRFDIDGSSDNIWNIATGDLDGDGRLDLLIANRTRNRISVFQNVSTNGVLTTNSFAPRFHLAAAGTLRLVKTADLDGDGRLDVVFGDEANSRIGIFRNTATGSGLLSSNSFASPVFFTTGNTPVGLAVGDINGDRKTDLAVANFSSGTVSVLRNISPAPGTFAFATTGLAGAAGMESVAFGDMDADGRLDIVAGAWGGMSLRVYRNSNGTSFLSAVSFAAGGNVHDVELGDLDGDGKLDVALVREQESALSLFRNIASPGTFNAGSLAPRLDFGSGWNAAGVTLADFNLDGRPDIVFGNTYDSDISIYENITAPICAPTPSGLVSLWRGEGNGLDSAGTNDAVLEGQIGFVSGMVGQAFGLASTNGWLRVPSSTSLNVGLGAGFTIEGWISLRDVTNKHSIAEWNNGSAWGVHFHIDPISFNAGPGTLYANIVTSGGGWRQIRSQSGVVTTNGLHHVALTYDKASGVARIFRNGSVVVQQSIGSFTPLTSYDLYLGKRPSTGLIGFEGLLDEISLYDRALTTNEIAGIYNAGSLGKCYTNSPPIAVADAFSTASNAPVAFSAAKLLLNDMDPDGDVLAVVAVGTNTSFGGTASLSSGVITYQPASGFSGTDSFSYLVSDGRGGTASGSVFVTVGNGGPVGLNIVFGPIMVGDSFVVNFAGIPGLTYTIEGAPALLGPWSKIMNMTAPSINTGNGVGVFQLSEPVGTNATRFYRTIYPAY